MLYQRELKEAGDYDLSVCGGGFSGIAASMATQGDFRSIDAATLHARIVSHGGIVQMDAPAE